MRIEKIRAIIRENINILREKYFVKRIGVFGSTARGEETRSSDIDIVVEFYQPISFFTFLELEDYLSKILKKKVDLVSKKALKPAIKSEVLKEILYV